MRSFAGIVIALLAVSAAMTAKAASTDCGQGCDSKDRSPVCGADGHSYQNECLARCQGVAICDAKGPCPRNRADFLEPRTDLITRGSMDRFKAEGFRLLGQAKMKAFDPAESARKLDDSKPNEAHAFDRAQMVQAVRYTSDGLVYAAAAVTKTATDRPDGFIPPGLPVSKPGPEPAARKLLTVFGTDDRQQITWKAGYPYSAVGQLRFSAPGGGGYICSGSMIGAGAVLTAAHCVFDRATQSWQQAWKFAADQYVQGGVQQPYGVASWAHVTIFSLYTDTSISWYDTIPVDLAVIQLAGAGATLGSQTGWLGLWWQSSFNSVLYTAGYPGDKPSYSFWKTQCAVVDSDGADGRIANQCDIAGGQSGSPMFIPTGSAYSVHGVVKGQDGSSNYAAEITSANYNTLWSWR